MLAFFLTLCLTPLILETPIVVVGYELNQRINLLKPVDIHPTLNTWDFVHKASYYNETHQVVTEDNYVLDIHRITGSKKDAGNATGKPVVFLMHGLLVSSASWVLPAPKESLAFILADQGYDVWMGNARGSFYSRKHLNYTVEDKEFWMFSWHEIGIYDLPAMIDYILEKTGKQKLFYIGHSQGTTSFFVMGSERPQYQNKVEAMFAMAPVAYCSRMFSPSLVYISWWSTPISALLNLLGQYELNPTPEFITALATKACTPEAIKGSLCSDIIYLLCGYDVDHINTGLMPTIFEHVPAGASVRQILHYGQLIWSGKFRQYDHGWFGNWKAYGKLHPPSYNVGNIKTPVYLHYSDNDWMSAVEDVQQLYNELANPVMKLRVPDNKFSHLDFIWGLGAKSLVYDDIVTFLSNHVQKTNANL